MRIPPVPSSIWLSELRLICLRRRLADSLKISKAAAGSKRRKLTEYRGSNALSFLVSGPVRRLARRVPNRDSDKVSPASSWLRQCGVASRESFIPGVLEVDRGVH